MWKLRRARTQACTTVREWDPCPGRPGGAGTADAAGKDAPYTGRHAPDEQPEETSPQGPAEEAES